MSPQPSPYHTALGFIAIGISLLTAVYVMNGHSKQSSGNIAFVDFAAVMQESQAGKSINEQVAPKQKQMQDATEAKFKEFKQEETELKKQQGSLTAEQYEAKNQAFQAKIADWNAQMQQRQAALNTALAPAGQKVQQTLRAQVADIAAENHFVAVLPLEQSFYAAKALDITSEAIRRLDAKLPKVDIQFDKEEK